MANSWLRLYHDMPNDPKWRTIARVSKQPITVVLSLYLHLLVCASAAAERGTLDGYNIEDLATALDVDTAAVGAILVAMQGRVLEGDKLSGWNKRQTAREDSSTERVKKWRETKVKRNVTQCNAVKPEVTADKNREEEIRKETTKTLASTAVAVPAARGKLVCTLPLNQGNHEVFEADVQQWQALYPAVDVRQELRSIKGWSLANPQRRKTKTGIAKFVNSWLSRSQNEAKPGGGSGNRNQSKTGGNVDAARQALAILAAAERDFSAPDEVQPAAGSSDESGDLSHLRTGSIEL